MSMVASGREPLVLVADDDDELRTLIAASLRREELQVAEAQDGFELRDYLQLCSWSVLPAPDLVVADVRMPGVTGPEALAKFCFEQSRVVLITCCLDTALRDAAARDGVAAIFEKPFRLGQLVSVINRALGRSDAHQQPRRNALGSKAIGAC